MYRVEVDGHTIHDPRDEHFILPYAKLDLELNKTGSFELDITTENPGYEYVSPMKSVISVYDDGKLIFRGRSTTEEKDFYNTGTLKCEGELSYFVDTILRPRSSAFIRQTNRYIFSEVVKEHNNQVGADKQFQPGIIDVDQEEISSISFNYEKPLDFINKNLIEKYKGYLRIRYADGKRYLDWVKQYGDLSGQEIRFGYNLLDLKKTLVSTDVCTMVVPVGGSDKKVTVQNAVVGGKTYGKDYIQNDEAVNYFGKIIKMQEFPDKKSPNELYAEGEKWLLENMKSSLTVELTALDLHMVDVNIDDFKLGDLVKVVSVPHSIVFKDDLPVIEKYSYDITDPSKNTITVGKTLKVFTERKDPVIYDKVQEVTGRFEGYVETTDGKIEEITNEIQEFKTLVIQDFTAVNGSIEQLTSKQADFETATAENFISTNAEISNLSGDFVSFKIGEFDSLKAKQADFETATAEHFTAVQAQIDSLDVGNLDAKYATIENLNAANATIKKLESETVKTSFLESNYMKTVDMKTEFATITNLNSLSARIGDLETNSIDTKYLDTNYAKIDLGNIADGVIKNAMIAKGAIDTVQIADGSITSAKIVELAANKITSGTLSVERLEIRGSNKSIVYSLNNITGALQTQNIETLNGEIMTPRTITADKLVAKSITAGEIAAATITATEILGNTITADKLKAGTITATSGCIASLDANKITAGVLNAARIEARSITADKIKAATITGDEISAGTITGKHIVAESITATSLDVNSIFAQDITATGTITGINLVGATGSFSGNITANSGEIGGWNISINGIYKNLPQVCNIQNYNASTHDNYTGTFIGSSGYSSFTVKPTTYESMETGKLINGTLANNTIIQNGKLKLYESRYSKQENIWNPEFGAYLTRVEIGGRTIKISENDSTEFTDSGWTDVIKIDPYYISCPSLTISSSIETNNVITLESDGMITCGGVLCRGDGIGTSGDIRLTGTNYLKGSEVNLIRWTGSEVGVGDSSKVTGIWGSKMNMHCNIQLNPNDNTKYLNTSGNARLGYLTMDGNIALQDHNMNITGEHGLYSNTMSNFIVRYYISGSTKSTALGNNSYQTRIYGSSVWANKAISTSDERIKESFSSLEQYEDIFMSLNPTAYQFLKGYEPTKLTHFGFRAQQIRKAFSKKNLDPSFYALNGETSVDAKDYNERMGINPGYETEYGICYEEIIALNTHMIQKNRKDMNNQIGRIDMQQAIINDLQNRLWQAEKEIKELKQAAQ